MIEVVGTLDLEVQVTQAKPYNKIYMSAMMWDTKNKVFSQVYQYFNNEELVAEKTFTLAPPAFYELVSKNVDLIKQVRTAINTRAEQAGFIPQGWTDSWPGQ